MVIEHLRKDSHNGSFVLIDGAFDIDIEKNGFGLTTSCTINLHESGRIVLKLLAEHLYGSSTANRSIL